MIGSRRLVQLGACLSSVHYNFYQTAMTSLLVPPSSLRGQNKLDPDYFKQTLEKIPSLILPTKSLNEFRGKLKEFILKFPKFKPVQPVDDKKEKSIIYLDPRKVDKITDDLKKLVSWDKNFKESNIKVTYENWPCDEVLRAVLPENVEVPTSYSIIGHIVHLNLRDEQLPYKTVIGQIFLDKIPTARTVVNKLDAIDNTFRNFAMEILVGEQNTVVAVKECGHLYSFDFAKVYWNPRLCTEHAAIVSLLKEGDILYDIFAGVGPFAIPAAKKGVRVLANDLNTESCKWLLENKRQNKIKKQLNVFNMDGREFLRDKVKSDILERRKENATGSEHITLNLPAIAVEFLDVFSELTDEEIDLVCSNPPTVHVYCFIKAAKTDDFKAITKSYVEENLCADLTPESLKNIHHVRNVAPNKEMMRVSFLLTKEVLKECKIKVPERKKSKLEKEKADNNEKLKEDEGEEPAKKKLRLDEEVSNDNNVTGKNGKEQGEECIQSSRSEESESQEGKESQDNSEKNLGQGNKLNKEKTNQINKQLAEISKEVHRPQGKKKQQKVQPVKATSGPSKEQTTELVEKMQTI